MQFKENLQWAPKLYLANIAKEINATILRACDNLAFFLTGYQKIIMFYRMSVVKETK